jgi:hypothetical protein
MAARVIGKVVGVVRRPAGEFSNPEGVAVKYGSATVVSVSTGFGEAITQVTIPDTLGFDSSSLREGESIECEVWLPGKVRATSARVLPVK